MCERISITKEIADEVITRLRDDEVITRLREQLELVELDKKGIDSNMIMLRKPGFNDNFMNIFRDINNFIFATHHSIVQDIFVQERFGDVFTDLTFDIGLQEVFKLYLFPSLHYYPKCVQEVYIIIDCGDCYKICGENEIEDKVIAEASIIPKKLVTIYEECDDPDDCDEIITVINGYIERAVVELLSIYNSRLTKDVYNATKTLVSLQRESAIVTELYDKFSQYIQESDDGGDNND